MPGGRGGVASPHWFEDIFGFPEGSYPETKKRFTFEEDVLRSNGNGASFHVGPFETPSVEELGGRLAKASGVPDLGGLTFANVVGDVRALHRDAANAGAVFQVASQFNCLEMNEPGAKPENGVTRYYCDATQGPACAVTCAAATVFRNYFVNGHGQAGKHQIDCLADVGELLGNGGNVFWRMVNGYCLPSASGSIAKISGRIKADPALGEAVQAKLRVGVHWDTSVQGRSHRVCQVFVSALPLAYAKDTRSAEWQPFACAILDAAYDATLMIAALLAEQRQARVKVFLTAVGGGAFGNRTQWITDAIDRAMTIHAAAPLDVMLVSFSTLPRGGFAALEKGRGPATAKAKAAGKAMPKARASTTAAAQAPSESSDARVSPAAMITRAFSNLDENGDGVLDSTELTKAIRLLDPTLPEDEVQALFAAADADDDGLVHYAEFAAWLCSEDSTVACQMLRFAEPIVDLDGGILSHLAVCPYGVLGDQLATDGSTVRGVQPDQDIVIVDAAGLPFIQEGPIGAGGASGAVYQWLGIEAASAFPDVVRGAIKAPLAAKFHTYGVKNCIHVVGPDFDQAPCERVAAMEQLAKAYSAVFAEFVACRKPRLRLLPVSGGIFAGSHWNEMPQLSMEAIQQGFEMLDEEQKRKLFAAERIEFCIFMQEEFEAYEKAYATAVAASR
mmetsp:Transcript_42650/g.92965  ORF Transcript_42650/g.92965 Transcript_42650/m.92965 type:complete len:674 (-) Transcript_42650:60-2081(-)